MRVGARYIGDGTCEFVVWAPNAQTMDVRLTSGAQRIVPMEKRPQGYWTARVTGVDPGTAYLFRFNGSAELPDPASHFQPQGVHSPSRIVDHGSFSWNDGGWRGMGLSDAVIYELHVGTFTPEGTLSAIIPRIRPLKDLGVTAIEIMPLPQFPGARNWGYDGVYPYSVHSAYGGPEGLKLLVDACHEQGMAVILDVVYNHLGPEGNYLGDYGPYFTNRYQTAWGPGINFDGPWSNEVRNFFIENALHWFENYHIDALRLDAVHGITDLSAKHFLAELREEVRSLSDRTGKTLYLIAESDLNDSRLIRSPEAGGYGLDAQWCDDFHHSLHTLLTGEDEGHYCDFGDVRQMVKSMREAYVYTGQYSVFRRRNHGNSAKDRPAGQFVVSAQNHDQVGNRMEGERLSKLVSFEGLKLAAGVLLLSPYIPLLFMGEEYGERSPFYYFVSHSDPLLLDAVRKGRREEFSGFSGNPPDPGVEQTFLDSKLHWETRDTGNHRYLLDLYRQLLRWRRELPCLSSGDSENTLVYALENEKVVLMHRWKGAYRLLCIFNFNRSDVQLKPSLPEGEWIRKLDSSDTGWNGPGSLLPEKLKGDESVTLRGHSFAVFSMEKAADD